MSVNLRTIYAEIASSYERANRVMTFGLDRVWRRTCLKAALESGGSRFLDVCSGTGETAIALRKHGSENASVVAADFSPDMLAVARAKKESRGIAFVIAEAGALPFPDNHFDTVTITFATRNLNTSREALVRQFAEFRRVIKPGGRFINLETSVPKVPLFRWYMRQYVKMAVKPIGRAFSGTKAGYAYLTNSIIRFHTAEELAAIIHEAGFPSVTFRRMTFGAVALHVAVK